MASLVSRLWMKLCKKRPVMSIMIVGLDNSGKTSILNNLSSLNQPPPSSTVSASQEPFSTDNKSSSRATQSSSDATRWPASKSCDRPIDASKRQTARGSSRGDQDNITPTVGYNYERIQYKGLTFTALDFSGQNRYRNLWQEFYNCVDAIVFVIDSSDLIRLVVVRDELETLLSDPYFGTLSGESDPHHGGDNLDRKLRPLMSTGAQKQITLNQGKLVQSPLEDRQSSSSSSSSVLSPSSKGSNNTTRPSVRRRRVKIPILFLANKSDLANSVDVEVIVVALNLNQLPKSRHPWLIQATSVNLNQGIGEGFDWLVSQLTASAAAATATQSEPALAP